MARPGGAGPQHTGDRLGGGGRVGGDGGRFGPGPPVPAVLVGADLGGGARVPVHHRQAGPAAVPVHQGGAERGAERFCQSVQRGRGAGRGGGHRRPRRGTRATPPYRSHGWATSPAGVRHSLTGTTPGVSSGSPPNRPVTWAWVRGVTGAD